MLNYQLCDSSCFVEYHLLLYPTVLLFFLHDSCFFQQLSCSSQHHSYVSGHSFLAGFQEIQFVDHYCHPFRPKRSTALILSKTFFTKHSILILRCSRRATKHGCSENSEPKNKTIFQYVNTDYFKPSWLPVGGGDSHKQKDGVLVVLFKTPLLG